MKPWFTTAVLITSSTGACAPDRSDNHPFDGGGDTGPNTHGSDSSGEAGSDGDDHDPGGVRLDVGGATGGPGGGDGGAPPDGDPETCAEAARRRTYVGCEFWPTVTFNPVLQNFDFAAVVANTGEETVQVDIERGGTVVTTGTVDPGGLSKFLLPWVPELKGPQFDARTTGERAAESVRVEDGAYRVTTSAPVTVWQFNPLQYEDELSDCALVQDLGIGPTCLSVSNDASLLLPATSLSGNYRVFLQSTVRGTAGGYDDTPGSVAITATRDDTRVDVHLVAGAAVASGTGITAIQPGRSSTFTMNAGDVVQLLAEPGSGWGTPHPDLSGSVVTADRPVQVIGTVALTSVPSPAAAGQGYADHLEEIMPPAETLGDHYVVTPPTSSQGTNLGAYLRLYGNFDGTELSYSGARPASAPERLDASDVVSLEVHDAFEVHGSQPFAIGIFIKGGEVQTPGEAPTVGDPAFALAVPVAQYRDRYVFLAPTDYLVSYADILAPAGTRLTLDGRAPAAQPQPVAGTDWVVVRERLGDGNDGAHSLLATDGAGHPAQVGLFVMGYGHATGYLVPGGLDAEWISDPPPPPG